MFSIQHISEDGFEKIGLKFKDGTEAIILPQCGAMLHSFFAGSDPAHLNVVENYNSYDEFSNKVTQGFIGSKLSPFVCRLNKGAYHFAEKDYQFESFYLGDHAIHGTLFDKKFSILEESSGEDSASVKLVYQYRKDDKGFPFNYDCFVTWTLAPEQLLTVTTEIINRDEGLIPMQDGWHPYFTLGDKIDDLQLEFQAEAIVDFNEDLLPTGSLSSYESFDSLKEIASTELDNCFKLNQGACQPLCVLRNPKRKIEVQFFPDKSYPYLQVYTPPHRRSIAIENLSSAPDGFNNRMGLKTLEPSESAIFKTSYKIHLLP